MIWSLPYKNHLGGQILYRIVKNGVAVYFSTLSKESITKQFNEAKRCNDELKIYNTLIDIHLESQKFNLAVGLLRDAVKKFPESVDVSLYIQIIHQDFESSKFEIWPKNRVFGKTRIFD